MEFVSLDNTDMAAAVADNQDKGRRIQEAGIRRGEEIDRLNRVYPPFTGTTDELFDGIRDALKIHRAGIEAIREEHSKLGVGLYFPKNSLKGEERGLILSPPIAISADMVKYRSELDASELRAGIMYWDKICFPKNNVFEFGLSDDAGFLIQEDLAFQTSFVVAGSYPHNELVERTYTESLLCLQKDGGNWALARGDKSLSVVEDVAAIDALSFKIHSGIPIPDRDVPLNEILEFKHRRTDEIIALRHAIDDVCVEIYNDPEGLEGESSHIRTLNDAILDHLKSTKEAKFRSLLSGVKLKIDRNTVVGAVEGYRLGNDIGMPSAISAVIGVAGGALYSASREVGWGKSVNAGSPYEYVRSIHRHL